jgi:hypothetical protein
MAINFSAAGGNYRREFHDRPTRHAIHEVLPGDRYSPWIQPRYGEGELRVAPYLPFGRITKDFYTYSVIRAYTVGSVDEQGYVVPANAILPVDDGTSFYEARPLVYREVDYAQSAFGDWPDTDAPLNLNPFTGTTLLEADVNAQNVVDAAANSDDPTGAGIAGRDFVGVKAASLPIGCVTDELLEGASRFHFQEFDPQESVTIQTMYTLGVPETNRMRYNYGQATRNAVIRRNDLVGAGTVVNRASLDLADMPYWVHQGETVTQTIAATEHDMIRAGDVVASDDEGNFVRFDVRVGDWNVAADTGAEQELNNRYPLAAVPAIVGRCHVRQRVVKSHPLSLVKTYQERLLGGSGTEGVEAWALRGNVMTADQADSIQETNLPEDTAVSATVDPAYGRLDAAADERFLMFIHLMFM